MGISNFLEIANKKVAIFPYSIDSRKLAQNIALNKKNDNAFMIVNLTILVKRYLEWQKKLPRVHPFYAVKCNNDPVILKILAQLGSGFDCASQAEIKQVVGNGLVSASRCLYANPCKTKSFIIYADQLGVQKMTFDSAEELYKVKGLNTNSLMLLRIAVSDPTATCPLGMKYGCKPPLLEGPKLLKLAAELNIRVIGIAFHVGSGCNDSSVFREAISISKELFKVGIQLGHNMHVLDIGGGFPGQDTKYMSFDKIVNVVELALEKYFPIDDNPNLEIIAEPGRYFASETGALTTNVIAAIKVPASRITKNDSDSGKYGYMYYVNDGIYGTFNCILFDHFCPIGSPLNTKKDSEIIENVEEYPTTIWGPTCDALDMIEESTKMEKLCVGDWIYYEYMGAYSSVAASRFNGFDKHDTYYVIDQATWEAINI